MFCREKSLKVGQQVTLKNPISSYFLPQGLHAGSLATVIESSYGTVTIEQEGKQWRISDRCIEYEYEYQVRPNCWLPKNHPLTIQAAAEEERRVAEIRKQLVTTP